MGKTEDAAEGLPEKNGGMLSAVVAVEAQARGWRGLSRKAPSSLALLLAVALCPMWVFGGEAGPSL